MIATLHGHKDAVLRVMPRLPINEVDLGGNTALHYAARAGDAEILGWLLYSGADFSVPNKCGETPLDLAKSFEHEQCVQTLQVRGPISECCVSILSLMSTAVNAHAALGGDARNGVVGGGGEWRRGAGPAARHHPSDPVRPHQGDAAALGLSPQERGHDQVPALPRLVPGHGASAQQTLVSRLDDLLFVWRGLQAWRGTSSTMPVGPPSGTPSA